MNFDYSATKKWLLDKGACDRCLGRQFHGLFKGDNGLIGAAVRASDSIEGARKKLSKPEKLKVKLSGECPFCNGLFLKVDTAADKAIELIMNFDFNSFLVGVHIQNELMAIEEQMWSEIGASQCEPLKKDLKRLIGQRIEKKTGKGVDFKNPDITVLVDFTHEPIKINLELNSLFIYGEYSKLKAGIPQTKWFCRWCRGKGCEKCNFTGKMYDESVEELIAGPLLEATGSENEKFHGAGREDINARMLGKRPFVIEMIRPIKRSINLKKLEKEINKRAKGKVKVYGLRASDKEEMRLLKTIKYDKTYELIVKCANDIDDEKLAKIEKEFTGKEIAQKTPTRVLQRRADLVRKREVKSVKCEKLGAKKFKVVVRAESGLYVKELTHGDGGRTVPSFSDIVGPCEVTELNVLKVHIRRGD
ncbi:MAG: tRNA pseudouridine(54/55) synthase Pus10 [Candidatus Diapherotrites archaeon]|nr:tRNA pseudouridine(54/55) synthase Pus10 [Candidatus Diapherotrites archaeon]